MRLESDKKQSSIEEKVKKISLCLTDYEDPHLLSVEEQNLFNSFRVYYFYYHFHLFKQFYYIFLIVQISGSPIRYAGIICNYI